MFTDFFVFVSALFRYETGAHLWLILEYCVGGNLMTLLDQVRIIGCELCITLMCISVELFNAVVDV